MIDHCLGRGDCGIFQWAVEREWLVTNNIGGSASGTLCEINTRRYHGLLTAAFAPPDNTNPAGRQTGYWRALSRHGIRVILQ